MSGNIKRLMREVRTILLVPIVDINGVPNLIGGTMALPTLTPFATPTTAVLNTWASKYTTAAVDSQHGGNISAATLDGLKLGLGASATDNGLVVTSIGNEQTATFPKVNSSLDFYRDLDPFAAGVFNLAWYLVARPDARFAIIDRVQGGKKNTAAFAIGDVISAYDVTTDHAIDSIGDKKFTSFSQAFVQSGDPLTNYTLAA